MQPSLSSPLGLGGLMLPKGKLRMATKAKYATEEERRAARIAPHIGNSYTKKFKTAEERKVLLEQYAAHRREGLTAESFSGCSRKTFLRLCEEFPEEFPAETLEAIESDYRAVWENILVKNATGQMRGQSVAAIFWAKAKLGFQDKQQSEISGKLEIRWGED